MQTDESLQQRFFRSLGGNLQLDSLFEQLPDVYFFAKTLSGQFVLCNSATLSALGLKHQCDLLGKTDYDLVPREIAEQYREADRRVVETARPVRNLVEPVPDAKGDLNWYVTSKIPLFAPDGTVAGVAVAMRDRHHAGNVLGPYQEMAGVMDHIFHHYADAVSIERLAEIAGLSVRQFERRFKKLFHVTPLSYLNRHRVRAACIALRTTDDSISAVAHRVGFYDHSHFVKQFQRHIEMTPSAYRERCTEDERWSSLFPSIAWNP